MQVGTGPMARLGELEAFGASGLLGPDTTYIHCCGIGKQADMVLLRTHRINIMPLNNAYGAVVLGTDTSNVDTLMVAGRIVKLGGQLVGADIGVLQRDIEPSRDRVLGTTCYMSSPTARTICNHHRF